MLPRIVFPIGPNLRGLRQVAGPLVIVTFVTESGFQPAQRGELDRPLPGSLRLKGLTSAGFQEIADVIHEALVAELAGAGIKAAPYESVAVNPGFRALAKEAPKTGKDKPVPPAYDILVRHSGARRAVTYTGRRHPLVDSFLTSGYLPATRLTRELNAALPIIAFLVDFVVYPGERTATFDWSGFMTAAPASGSDLMRARPQIYVAGGSVEILMPGGQTASLTLTTPSGFNRRFVAGVKKVKAKKRAGASYEVTVDPAAYKLAVIETLKPHLAAIVRKMAAASH